ncbi:Cytochrome P450 704C1 [Vitis vinifera]|uniref:Cytochrome P450 704C1 n=1 Tax=Vitis vinifera TaxID=29760 RepID=A0A438JH32_VITVI|nr:Cytochrome P450 704C1 [Vitis vinifera]
MLNKMEMEADYIGLLLMASAGYDPRIAPRVYEKLGKVAGDSTLKDYLSTHPSGKKRAQLLAQAKVMEEALTLYREARAGRGIEVVGRMLEHLKDRLSGLIEEYWGSLSYATDVFRLIQNPSPSVYNIMIRAYACKDNGVDEIGLWQPIILYKQMLCSGIAPNYLTFPFLVKECTKRDGGGLGLSVHGQIIKFGFHGDLFVQNALISFYSATGSVQEDGGEKCITWNSTITGLVQGGRPKEAVEYFFEMQVMSNDTVRPDKITIASVLSACASLGAIDHGKWVHSYLKRSGLECDMVIGTALVDMYGKCGCVESAIEVFRKMPKKDILAWTAMISALLFMGLVHHYACMVDLLSRAGLFEEAEGLIRCMPMQPDVFVWGALLGGFPGCSMIEICGVVYEFSVTGSPEVVMGEVEWVLNGLKNVMKMEGRMHDLCTLHYLQGPEMHVKIKDTHILSAQGNMRVGEGGAFNKTRFHDCMCHGWSSLSWEFYYRCSQNHVPFDFSFIYWKLVAVRMGALLFASVMILILLGFYVACSFMLALLGILSFFLMIFVAKFLFVYIREKYITYRMILPSHSEIYTADPVNVEYILKTNFINYGKGEYHCDIMKDLFGDGIFAVDGEKWRTSGSLQVMNSQRKFCRDFSTSVFQDNAAKLVLKVSMVAAAKQMMDCRYVDLLWRIKRFLNLGLEAALKHNIKRGKEDILSRFLLESKKDPKKMNDRYLRDIILSFVIAGKDTSADTLTWFFYLLCKHPLVQEKVVLEVREATKAQINIPADEFAKKITEKSLDKMQYLHAALTETLRLYPAVPMVMCAHFDPSHARFPFILVRYNMELNFYAMYLEVSGFVGSDTYCNKKLFLPLKGSGRRVEWCSFIQTWPVCFVRSFQNLVFFSTVDGKHSEEDDILPDGFKVKKGDGMCYMAYAHGENEMHLG